MLGYSNGIAEQASEYGAALAHEEFWRLDFVFLDLWVGVTFLFWGFDCCQISHWEFTHNLKSLTSSAQKCDLKWWRTMNDMTWHDITWHDLKRCWNMWSETITINDMTQVRPWVPGRWGELGWLPLRYPKAPCHCHFHSSEDDHHFARMLNSRQGKAWLCQRGSCWAHML